MKKLALLLLVLSFACVSQFPESQPIAPKFKKFIEIPPYIAPRIVTRSVQAYQFIHDETTGLAEAIKVDNAWQWIQFTPESNKRALSLLYDLKTWVFLPNTNENNVRDKRIGGLFVVGQYYDGISQTGQRENSAPNEEYHEFRLDRWYLLPPIIEVVDDEGSQSVIEILRSKLKKSDFIGSDITSEELSNLHKP